MSISRSVDAFTAIFKKAAVSERSLGRSKALAAVEDYRDFYIAREAFSTDTCAGLPDAFLSNSYSLCSPDFFSINGTTYNSFKIQVRQFA